jgi:uncharacterized membrane protein
MCPLDHIVLSSALARDWAKAGKMKLTPSRSMTTAGSSSVPFLEMVFPFLLLTSALPALISATVPATSQLVALVWTRGEETRNAGGIVRKERERRGE